MEIVIETFIQTFISSLYRLKTAPHNDSHFNCGYLKKDKIISNNVKG